MTKLLLMYTIQHPVNNRYYISNKYKQALRKYISLKNAGTDSTPDIFTYKYDNILRLHSYEDTLDVIKNILNYNHIPTSFVMFSCNIITQAIADVKNKTVISSVADASAIGATYYKEHLLKTIKTFSENIENVVDDPKYVENLHHSIIDTFKQGRKYLTANPVNDPSDTPTS